MPAGVQWTGRLIITNSTEKDIDALCGALDRFSSYPMIGAQHARGCGEISGIANIETDRRLVKKISFGGFAPAQIDNVA